MRRERLAILTIIVLATAAVVFADAVRMKLPLDDGRLSTRDLVRSLAESLDVKLPRTLLDAPGSIDVESRVGARTIKLLEGVSAGALSLEVTNDHATLLVDREALEARARQTRTSVGAWVERVAQTVAISSTEPRRFGITMVTDEDARTPLAVYAAETPEVPERIVLLVHGLDDPGWMWRDMIPALRGAGHVVGRMEYPNDGAIADSADRFASELRDLRAIGVKRVDVVAHSMGGLVTRDLLTRAAYYDSDGAGNDERPAINRLIMCGTPNHGSVIVRLRGVNELQEHLSRAFAGEGTLFGGLSDGDGEAAVDLLPESDFLRRLNKRPLAKNVKHTIIAGRMSPVDAEDLEALGDQMRDMAAAANAPQWLRDLIDTAEIETVELVEAAATELGDGVVTIESARLAGVDDFVLVEANHASMIVNVVPAKTTAPAIPIVLDRLGDDDSDSESGSQRTATQTPS